MFVCVCVMVVCWWCVCVSGCVVVIVGVCVDVGICVGYALGVVLMLT